jgi:K+-sensing histidine kinase KdpD
LAIQRLTEQNSTRGLRARALTPTAEYAVAFGAFAAVSLLNLWLHQWIGYQSVALVYLLAVVCLALVVGRGAILFGAALTGFGWDYLFVPPRYSFHIAGFYDKMMAATYFIVALTIGQLTAQVRAQQLRERQRQERLRESETRARLVAESERLSRTLLNSVSHELRTPLAAIGTAAHSLRSSGPLTSTQQTVAGEIEAAAARLNHVVEGLLNAARLQSGQIRPALDWCDVSDLVKVALRNAGRWLAAHPVESRVPASLPLVKADFVLLEQALSNLLVNAAVHTPPGTPIEVTARIDDRRLALEVADRGPGLPAADVERIFELFHRAPNAKPGGTGLGLAIVKGFVEAQGGKVSAANRPGGGALFTISLAAAEAPNLPPDAP